MVEEFYIKLLESDFHFEIPSGVLGNYEVALLYLQKFGTVNLSEGNCRELNPEAFGTWAQNNNISIYNNFTNNLSQYIPEICKDVFIANEDIIEIPNLIQCNFLNILNSKIKYLPNLQKANDIKIKNSKIKEFPKLNSVNSFIITDPNKRYWVDYFTNTGRPEIAKKVLLRLN